MKKVMAIVMILSLTLLLPAGYLLRTEKEATVDALYMDEQENVYFVAYSPDWLEISRYAADGAFAGRWRTRRHHDFDYVTLADMAFSPEGRAFCVLSQIHSLDYSIARQRWLEIDFSTGHETTVYEQSFAGRSEPVSAGLAHRNGKLLCATVYDHEVEFAAFGPDTAPMMIHIPVDFTLQPNAAFPLSDHELLVSNAAGEIYTLQTDGTYKKQYGWTGLTGSFSQIKMDARGDLYLYHHRSGMWYKSKTARQNRLSLRKTDLPASDGHWTGDILDENRYAVLSADGRSASLYRHGVTTEIDLAPAFSYTTVASLTLAGGLFAAACMLAVRWRARRGEITVSLLWKQAAIILTVMCAGIVILSDSIGKLYEKSYQQAVITEILQIARKTAAGLDLDALAAIDWSMPERSAYFLELLPLFQYRISEISIRIPLISGHDNTLGVMENDYVGLFVYKDGEWRTGISDNGFMNIPARYAMDAGLAERLRALLDDRAQDALLIGLDDENSDWLSVYQPVYNEHGRAVALVESGISKRQYNHVTQQNVRLILLRVTLLMGTAASFLLFGLSLSLRSLKRLRRAVEAMGQGDYSVTVPVKGHDEIADISEAFNSMSAQIERHTKSLQEINNAYYRFLPAEVLDTLGKDSVVSVRRGDHTQFDTHILHIAIANFDDAAQSGSTHGIFSFFNQICDEVMDIVLSRGGLVESYNQTEFFCLFAEADAAYDAALSISRWLNALNHGQAKRLSLHLAMVKGEALIGVAGHEKRLSTLMLSGSISLARQLAGYAAVYGIRVIIPETVALTKPCLRRSLGLLDFEGVSIRLFDYYDGDEDDLFLSKKQLTSLFEKGVSLFEREKWEESKSIFIQYLRQSAHDPAAIQYLFLNEHNLNAADRPKSFGDEV